MTWIDMRSDTVTKPTEAMRRVMYEAPVGDAGYNDDPSVNALQDLAAEMTGCEGALFFPSGIMGNLAALLSLGERGGALAVGARAHIYQYEAGGLATFAGLTPKPLPDGTGCPTAADLAALARPADDVHFPPLKVLALENTHNDCGGIAVAPGPFRAVVEQARAIKLAVHLDGARLFNAAVACRTSVRSYTALVDTVQICLSKGLGAPMGSVLCGSRDVLDRARYHRKRLGGDLRQAGIMAGAARYALEHHVERLAEDHRRAAWLAEQLAKEGYKVEWPQGSTNMVYFTLPEGAPDDETFGRFCLERGLKFNFADPRRVRLVTHLDVDDDGMEKAACILKEALA